MLDVRASRKAAAGVLDEVVASARDAGGVKLDQEVEIKSFLCDRLINRVK
jgi:hypothetical protein